MIISSVGNIFIIESKLYLDIQNTDSTNITLRMSGLSVICSVGSSSPSNFEILVLRLDINWILKWRIK